jgi:TctA family transporter
MRDGTLRGVAAPEAANNAAAQTSCIPLLTPGFLPDR